MKYRQIQKQTGEILQLRYKFQSNTLKMSKESEFLIFFTKFMQEEEYEVHGDLEPEAEAYTTEV